MMMELLHFQIAEKINFSVVDLRDYYIYEYGSYDNWNADLESIFNLNSDMNIEALVEHEDFCIHPKAIKYGLSIGVTAIQFSTNAEYFERYLGGDESGTLSLSNDQKLECYNTMIGSIADFIFKGA